jgi:hypothetical protein
MKEVGCDKVYYFSSNYLMSQLRSGHAPPRYTYFMSITFIFKCRKLKVRQTRCAEVGMRRKRRKVPFPEKFVHRLMTKSEATVWIEDDETSACLENFGSLAFVGMIHAV